ncbi:hypothetical protein FOCC_FOCC001530 [Frankliniella occidentalis]|uniref:Bublin coiled-coil protein n=1 Tax=Frankliniella occidentalis TaxID=133901 RepID=A0A6J1S1B0_FRAOC|nr:bublin coiled-coil protein [Frankliniella occidentalis]KAE8751683.1 hypothetical protein FOCC_FOCC001530 [Frankliniella occidentalis]
MADDKHHTMTKGVDKLILEDDKKDEAEIDEEQQLNDDPDEDDISPEEFAALNSQMDQLNSALDVLEEQNDMIHAKLVDLLESNRAARKQFKEEQEKKLKETADKK